MAKLGVVSAREATARQLVAVSRGALDRTLEHPAELWVAIASDEATLPGAFARATGRPRRGSGGPEVLVGPGTVHVALAMSHPGALVDCDATRIVNRNVRPLLRALTKVGHLAHYFGRDWVSVGGRPVAWVGLGHDSRSGRTLFEAFVATRTPFASAARASFRGKEPGVLEGADPARLALALLDAYGRDAERVEVDPPALAFDPRDAGPPDPPWTATREEAIGLLGAGRDAAGIFRLGGDLLVSRDALARLEAGAPGCAGPEDLGRLVDETLGAPGVAIEGVRALASVRDVLVEALAIERTQPTRPA